MKILMFYHSLVSDWNHGNAHFLRGVVTELKKLSHDVQVFEHENNWSLENLLKERGEKAIAEFKAAYPRLSTNFYLNHSDLEEHLADADLVIVHEWNEPELVKYIGDRKKDLNYKLLFHDTHHRAVTAPEQMKEYDLNNYDGVLAFGKVLEDLYMKNGWAERAWTWHEAADTNLFKPDPNIVKKEGDIVWIGNWGDDERTEELKEFLIQPVLKLGLKMKMYGVRYPKKVLEELKRDGIEYGGYLPSCKVPTVFSRFKLTVHVPRRPYTKALPGIPTIRPFEALACGIPLISAPWNDCEHLFREGDDFRMVNDGIEMAKWMERILSVEDIAEDMKKCGYETIQKYHTCRHRAKELLNIYESI